MEKRKQLFDANTKIIDKYFNKRLIDANQFRGKHEVAEVNGKLCSVVLYADIVNAPTVDAVEVVHGR